MQQLALDPIGRDGFRWGRARISTTTSQPVFMKNAVMGELRWVQPKFAGLRDIIVRSGF